MCEGEVCVCVSVCACLCTCTIIFGYVHVCMHCSNNQHLFSMQLLNMLHVACLEASNEI